MAYRIRFVISSFPLCRRKTGNGGVRATLGSASQPHFSTHQSLGLRFVAARQLERANGRITSVEVRFRRFAEVA
jgi:hypothetical protein